MRRRTRTWVALASLGVLLVVGAFLSSSPVSSDAGPTGTLALRRFLAGSMQVRAGPTPPAGGTFVLVEDLRRADEEEGLVRWVEDGGRLVVTDPASELLHSFGVVRQVAVGG